MPALPQHSANHQKIASISFLNKKGDVIEKYIKGALSGLRQHLAYESPLKIMKNAFYFTLKAFFVLKIFNFLS